MKRTNAGAGVALVCALLAGCGGGGGGMTQQQPTITGVSVNLSATSITTAQTLTASATVTGTGNYASTVTWSVSPSSIGSITSAGVFTPAAAGTASITATSTEDTTKSGNASASVTQAITVSISPSSPTITIGTSQQFTASESGVSTQPTWDWTVADSTGGTSDAGTISSTGLYQSPYPPPSPATVTVTATSASDSTVTASATVTLSAPATAAGPVLTVDVGNPLHAISPYIYGMNAYALDTTSATTANVAVTRWGGDDTSRYNYQNGNTNSASDYYFQNSNGAANMLPNASGSTSFDAYVTAATGLGATVLGTMNVNGWVTNNTVPACSFTQTSYPNQQSYVNGCGNGVCPNGSTCGSLTCTSSGGCSLYGDASVPGITANQATAPACTISSLTGTSCANGVSTCMVQTCAQAAMPTAANATTSWAEGTWAGGWVNSVVSKFGPAKNGKGVTLWDLDNEPAWWDGVHRDVHPSPSTYDEVTWGGISTALAIKTVDSSALVDGPIIDYWWNYFYSKKDIENGWGSSASTPCWQPWSNPVDREAHGGVAMIPYYLQQMNQASTTYGLRLLDYLDIHGYFATEYPTNSGQSVAFTTAGDTGEQMARMNSVRALWDPTYIDPNTYPNGYQQPNYPTDPNYYNPTANNNQCNVPQQSPQVVPMLHAWVNGTPWPGDPNNNYPGTKTAIDEYNFGGLESINGAVTQADVLGVFGQYGLDLATLWPTQAYSTQGPGNYAFAMYRNYDLKNDGAMFGNTALASCSTTMALPTGTACTPIDANYQAVANMETGQGQLSVYGALGTPSTPNAVTVMVINKTYGPLTSTVSLLNSPTPGTVTAYQYSNANLTGIVAVTTGFTVTPATAPSTTSTISYTFPAQSITLFVIPE
jgi:Glycoside hydrolase family 44